MPLKSIHIVGVGADGLSLRSRAILSQADLVAGGKRHLELLGSTQAETFAITDNLAALLDRLKRRTEAERCAVMASGDPFFYGIGAFLRNGLAGDKLIVEPAVSSAQLAFARAGIAWQDAKIASIHGRPLEATLRPLLGASTIGIFTHDGDSPARVAAFFLAHGLEDYDAFVGEQLGGPSERVFFLPIKELIERTFHPLNFLVLHRKTSRPEELIVDQNFAQPESGPILLTHDDIRVLSVHRFRGLREGSIWDIGAGLGGVSIELAHRFPAREVVAIERSTRQLGYLRENRAKFAAHNLEIHDGEAPGALASLTRPAGVFLGGSGGKLDAILDMVVEQLLPGGIFVANFVTLENLSHCMERLKSKDWPTQVDQIQISQGRDLAGLTGFVPMRAVWIVKASKPDQV